MRYSSAPTWFQGLLAHGRNRDELPGAAAFWPALVVALVWRAVSDWSSRAALTLSVGY